MTRIQIPTYIDGCFDLYEIKEDDDIQATKYLENKNIKMYFKQLSTSDKLRSTLNANNVDVSTKLRIPFYDKINSNCVIKIGEEYHKVYNTYHFTDKQGFRQTDLTLTNWEGVYEER